MRDQEIELQLDALIQFEQQLQQLLKDEQYEQFEQQQTLFSEKIKRLLASHSAETLNTVIDRLKTLQQAIANLQDQSEQHFHQLKEKALLQKRNKNKLKAYK